MNNLLSLFIASVFVLSVPALATETQPQDNYSATVEKKTEEVKSSMTVMEKKVVDNKLTQLIFYLLSTTLVP